jgi:hypothetical protein
LPVLKTNSSAAAGNDITTVANVSAAIPVRAFEGMSASSVIDLPPSPVEDSRHQRELTLAYTAARLCQTSFIVMGARSLG